MSETRRKFNRGFREGAVRLVLETGKPIAQVARDLGIGEGTLGNWVARERQARGEGNGSSGCVPGAWNVLFDPDTYPLPTPNLGPASRDLFPWNALTAALSQLTASRLTDVG